MMTKLQREDMDFELKKLEEHPEPWEALNKRKRRELPWWVGIVAWVIVWLLVGIVIVFSFDKLERILAAYWPSL